MDGPQEGSLTDVHTNKKRGDKKEEVAVATHFALFSLRTSLRYLGVGWIMASSRDM